MSWVEGGQRAGGGQPFCLMHTRCTFLYGNDLDIAVSSPRNVCVFEFIKLTAAGTLYAERVERDQRDQHLILIYFRS